MPGKLSFHTGITCLQYFCVADKAYIYLLAHREHFATCFLSVCLSSSHTFLGSHGSLFRMHSLECCDSGDNVKKDFRIKTINYYILLKKSLESLTI